MSTNKPNPVHARAGRDRRFNVPTPVRKGFLHYVATLEDRVDAGYNGRTFKGLTKNRACGRRGLTRSASSIATPRSITAATR